MNALNKLALFENFEVDQNRKQSTCSEQLKCTFLHLPLVNNLGVLFCSTSDEKFVPSVAISCLVFSWHIWGFTPCRVRYNRVSIAIIGHCSACCFVLLACYKRHRASSRRFEQKYEVVSKANEVKIPLIYLICSNSRLLN